MLQTALHLCFRYPFWDFAGAIHSGAILMHFSLPTGDWSPSSNETLFQQNFQLAVQLSDLEIAVHRLDRRQRRLQVVLFLIFLLVLASFFLLLCRIFCG